MGITFNDKEQCSLDDFYEIYQRENPGYSFFRWMMKKFDTGEICVRESNVLSLNEFQNIQIEKRKEKLKDRAAGEYLKSVKWENRKQKKQLRKKYLSSDAGKEKVELLVKQDPKIGKFGDEKFLKKKYDSYTERMKQEAVKKAGCLVLDFEELQVQKYFYEIDIDSIFEKAIPVLAKFLQTKLDDVLEQETLYVKDDPGDWIYNAEWAELTKDNLEDMMDQFKEEPYGTLLHCVDPEETEDDYDSLESYLIDLLFEHCDEFAYPYETECDKRYVFFDQYDREVEELLSGVTDAMDFSALHIISCIIKNKKYHTFALKYYNKKRKELDRDYLEKTEWKRLMEETKKRNKMIHQSILSIIPDSYPDLYPGARQITRKFIIHTGPTNSGKTYQAMKSLKTAGSGIYLAPLRLLAYEQYENLNRDGYPCDLITGEEKTIVPFSKFQASTIEMADFSRTYDSAVIDEAQMITDRDRGGAWTAAILGLICPEIHICCAPYAKNLLIELIRQCKDTYEIVTHQRNTALVCESEPFYFPDSVEKGDALIVFTKKNVHAVASELQRRGRKCSIIYGNLPYDVRREEARKFLEHETDIVVATDAIGMGMNLPIRRIVFLEMNKFDGFRVRPLFTAEIGQIAGRAGRQGMFEVGHVSSLGSRKLLRQALNETPAPLTHAVISFPESFIDIPAKLSETLKRWDEIPVAAGYLKANIKDQISLCTELESFSDNKMLIYRFVMIPFNVDNPLLKRIWLQFFKDEIAGRPYNYRQFLPEIYDRSDASYLEELEVNYHVCDLLYAYMDRFHRREDFGDILSLKGAISKRIMKILSTQKMKPRKCKECGKPLSWNYPYGMCEKCYHSRWGWQY